MEEGAGKGRISKQKSAQRNKTHTHSRSNSGIKSPM